MAQSMDWNCLWRSNDKGNPLIFSTIRMGITYWTGRQKEWLRCSGMLIGFDFGCGARKVKLRPMIRINTSAGAPCENLPPIPGRMVVRALGFPSALGLTIRRLHRRESNAGYVHQHAPGCLFRPE